MSERIQVPTTQLFDAMEAKLAAEQAAPQVAAETAASEETARIIAEREKQAAELQRAWQNPTVMAKFREREAGLVAGTAEVRDVIAQSQVDLAGKERRNPSNALEGEGRVETDKVKGINGKVIHNTKGGFARDFARDAATDPRHFAQSGRKARQELNREVSEAASEKSLTRRIGTLKKELARAHDNQEDFKARQLEEKLTEAREELVVQRALTAERKAAEAKKAAQERAATVAKGVKALDKDERKRSKAERVDRSKVNADALTVLDSLNGTKPNKPAGQGAGNPTGTAEVTPPETEKPVAETPDPNLASMNDVNWSLMVVSRIDTLVNEASISLSDADQQELLLGIAEASKSRSNTQAELEEIAQMAVSHVAAKRAREAAAREAEGYASSVPEQAGTSGAGGRDAEAQSDTTEAPKGHESLNNFDVRVGLAEKPLKGEDASLVDEQNSVYAVFDGLGGHRGGDIASKNARDAISAYFAHSDAPGSIEEAVQQMKEAFSAARQAVPDGGAEGLTTAAVTRVVDIEGQKYLVAGNAGDSRIILYRDGQLTDITHEQGSGNVVDNCFGSGVNDHLKDEFTYISLKNGDKVLVCSDGITGDWAHQVLSDTEFADAFGQDDPQASADRFIQLSKKDDDKTAIVLFVGEKGDTTSGEPEAPVADELDLPQDEPESDDPDELDKPFWGDDDEAELEAQRKRTALGIAQRRELERQEAERTVNPDSIRLSRAQKMAARVVGLVAKMYVNSGKGREYQERRMRERAANKATQARHYTFTEESAPPLMKWMAQDARILDRTPRPRRGQERGNGRRIAAGVAAGALAVGALGAGAKFVADRLGDTAAAQTQAGLVKPPKGPGLVEPPRETTPAVTDALKKGETVVQSVREQIERLGITMPSKEALNAFLRQETGDVLKLNNWTSAQARELPVGQIVKLQADQQMLEDASKFIDDLKKKPVNK